MQVKLPDALEQRVAEVAYYSTLERCAIRLFSFWWFFFDSSDFEKCRAEWMWRWIR